MRTIFTHKKRLVKWHFVRFTVNSYKYSDIRVRIHLPGSSASSELGVLSRVSPSLELSDNHGRNTLVLIVCSCWLPWERLSGPGDDVMGIVAVRAGAWSVVCTEFDDVDRGDAGGDPRWGIVKLIATSMSVEDRNLSLRKVDYLLGNLLVLFKNCKESKSH